jgi:hypothetical protein
LSVPAPRLPRHDSAWGETIRYAIDSDARTFRLCLILLVTAVSPVVGAVIAVLVHHMLLCTCSPSAGVSSVRTIRTALGLSL